MRAVELTGFSGIQDLKLIETAIPEPEPDEVLIEVKASGVNFAELELIKGRYTSAKRPPFIMGFEAAGVVVRTGGQVSTVRPGDRVAALVSSGGYAEYATAAADACIPIPDEISFAEATTIPVQGVSAYALLHLAAKPQTSESLLIQSAAGGVGLYLVQLAKIMGVKTVIALASSSEKITLLRSLGADIALDYSVENWPEQARSAVGGNGVDVVLEAASGPVGAASFKLLAPFGRMVVFGARNIHDSMSPDQIRQLIVGNQTIIGFNIPTMRRESIAPLVPPLLNLIAGKQVKLFATGSFPLAEVAAAFEAFSSRRTVGKIVLKV